MPFFEVEDDSSRVTLAFERIGHCTKVTHIDDDGLRHSIILNERQSLELLEALYDSIHQAAD